MHFQGLLGKGYHAVEPIWPWLKELGLPCHFNRLTRNYLIAADYLHHKSAEDYTLKLCFQLFLMTKLALQRDRP